MYFYTYNPLLIIYTPLIERFGSSPAKAFNFFIAKMHDEYAIIYSQNGVMYEKYKIIN